jgi:hypothetical protein
MRELSIDVRPVRAWVSADGDGVHIEWPGGMNVVYDIDWLNEHDHTNDSVHACHTPIELECRCIQPCETLVVSATSVCDDATGHNPVANAR